MTRRVTNKDYTSLLEILETVEKTPDSAFFLNPPQLTEKPSLLFLNAVEKFTLNVFNLNEFFEKVEDAQSSGFRVVMMLEYEAGYLFSEKFSRFRDELKGKNLGLAMIFKKEPVQIELSGLKPGHEPVGEAMISPLALDQSKDAFIANIFEIKNRIKAGDTYQINHTLLGKFRYTQSPAKIFASVLFNQTTLYSAFINTGERAILSFSPELFFSLSFGLLSVRPMKGTIKRRLLKAERGIRNSPLPGIEKQRAENLMIADLLRNDLHKICNIPLTRVSLFRTEKYESVEQMVSLVRGALKPGITTFDLFKAMYPCGSITGAPKISSMNIIREREKRERGLYTGTIGFINQQKMRFNVAIRTLVLHKKRREGTVGLGAGIVWDSDPESEYEECMLKGEFFTKPVRYFRIFETMLLDNGKIPLFEHHVERIERSAKELLFHFDKNRFTGELLKAIYETEKGKTYRLKLLIGKYGDVERVIEELKPLPEEIAVAFSATRTNSDDNSLYNKTTIRDIYDSERTIVNERGLFDLIYMNERDEVTEGGITNIFIRKGNDWLTPHPDCGLLEGIGRKLFMQKYRVVESVINREQVLSADEIVLTNALRGEIKVDKITD